MKPGTVFLLVALLASDANAKKFFPDDPLRAEPPQRPVLGPEARALSEILELASSSLGQPGERHPERGVIPAVGVNTLGEVMDGPWYVNRHGSRRMSREELVRGRGDETPPSMEAKWEALVVKPFGFRPGILIRDSRKGLYLLRFDPPEHREMATGAEIVTSRFFHALGYHVPENYIVRFDRSQLVVGEGAEGISSAGVRRGLLEIDVDEFLAQVAGHPGGAYRAVATRAPSQWSGLLGPFQFYDTRSDDPNDVVPHEHRRDLRGLFVFSAWLNHTFMNASTTLDAIVEEDGTRFVRHYLVDFTGALGSGGTDGPKSAWLGNEELYPGVGVLKNIVSFGVYTPAWMRTSYPGHPAVGRLAFETFEPDKWTPIYETAPFANRLPDDELWGAKQVMAFTDEDIEAIVETGEYSDPEAAAWIVRCLIERRDRVGKTYFAKLLPLDSFRVDGGKLAFDDLEVRYGFAESRRYDARWLSLDNGTGVLSRVEGASGLDLPRVVRESSLGSYFAARIHDGNPERELTVSLRKESDGYTVVGIDRNWPGKVVADPAKDVDTGRSRYTDLSERQKTIFEAYARDYSARRGKQVTAQEYFDSLTISERTTFDAVAHALENTKLTDSQGSSLGNAFELVQGIERIAGQYYGRSGDQQFRLYVFLVPGTAEVLAKSREFVAGHENTVYHVGYPHSFRQTGKEPTIQFSISEDGAKADIDVDYRSSKSPQALFNGHLTSANSDVREGDNYIRHAQRWGGFVAWWREVFGKLDPRDPKAADLLSADKPEAPTPLPEDRPLGASIPDVQDAVQEFLTDWLVREKYEEAVEVLSPRTYACLNIDDQPDTEVLGAEAARGELLQIMRFAAEQLPNRRNLTEAIDAVPPFNPARVTVTHPFASDFLLMKLTEEEAIPYLCGQKPAQPTGAEYYGVLLRFKKRGSAILGFLWTREEGRWRIASYRAFEQ